MNAPLRAISRALGSVPLLVGWVGMAVGGMVGKAGTVHLVPPPVAKHPEPQVEFVNAISLLLAVSLSMLAYGYLFDGHFSQPSDRTASPGRPWERRGG